MKRLLWAAAAIITVAVLFGRCELFECYPCPCYADETTWNSDGTYSCTYYQNGQLVVETNYVDNIAGDFCDGWEDGYQQALEDCLRVGLTPLCPLEPLNSDGYKTGFGKGYAAAQATHCF